MKTMAPPHRQGSGAYSQTSDREYPSSFNDLDLDEEDYDFDHQPHGEQFTDHDDNRESYRHHPSYVGLDQYDPHHANPDIMHHEDHFNSLPYGMAGDHYPHSARQDIRSRDPRSARDFSSHEHLEHGYYSPMDDLSDFSSHEHLEHGYYPTMDDLTGSPFLQSSIASRAQFDRTRDEVDGLRLNHSSQSYQNLYPNHHRNRLESRPLERYSRPPTGLWSDEMPMFSDSGAMDLEMSLGMGSHPSIHQGYGMSERLRRWEEHMRFEEELHELERYKRLQLMGLMTQEDPIRRENMMLDRFYDHAYHSTFPASAMDHHLGSEAERSLGWWFSSRLRPEHIIRQANIRRDYAERRGQIQPRHRSYTGRRIGLMGTGVPEIYPGLGGGSIMGEY